MKLTAVAKKEIPSINVYRATKLYKILQEFANSEMSAARIDDHGYKNATSARASFHASIKRFGMKNIIAMERQGQVYLIKEL